MKSIFLLHRRNDRILSILHTCVLHWFQLSHCGEQMCKMYIQNVHSYSIIIIMFFLGCHLMQASDCCPSNTLLHTIYILHAVLKVCGVNPLRGKRWACRGWNTWFPLWSLLLCLIARRLHFFCSFLYILLRKSVCLFIDAALGLCCVLLGKEC